jgi:hypothetical protein
MAEEPAHRSSVSTSTPGPAALTASVRRKSTGIAFEQAWGVVPDDTPLTPEEKKMEEDALAFEREWGRVEEIRDAQATAVEREMKRKSSLKQMQEEAVARERARQEKKAQLERLAEEERAATDAAAAATPAQAPAVPDLALRKQMLEGTVSYVATPTADKAVRKIKRKKEERKRALCRPLTHMVSCAAAAAGGAAAARTP